ncbi:hypothetical protein [Ulvibacter antarcticus]|uniref:Uncharacterized protein n=1 Tax=Ulvibacter antarcticus TaxID=442714 RepID=A0A3L9YC46_9FLAO|nr:hypothetical protein [Ulvibacter antarcticus]RMA57944.1 hypothetical protein BXY75_2751 [Ulvibacter antarcticus]
MEERYKKIDDISKKLIKEAGLQQPSTDFLTNVMSVVAQKAAKKIYKPLISKMAWVFIGLVVLLVSSVLFIVPLSHVSFFGIFDAIEKVSIHNPFSEVKVSKITIYGLGFLGLFLVQIPFLKRHLNRT